MGATLVAASYSVIRLVMLWILPLFPAEPKLGPIYQDVTHMVPMDFPLLLIVPAAVMDVVRQRLGTSRSWRLAIWQGLAFFGTFLAAQWLFAYFLVSEASRNWFFATDNFPYNLPRTSSYYRGEWSNFDGSTERLLIGLAIAAVLAVLSATLGAAWGRWLARVKR